MIFFQFLVLLLGNFVANDQEPSLLIDRDPNFPLVVVVVAIIFAVAAGIERLRIVGLILVRVPVLVMVAMVLVGFPCEIAQLELIDFKFFFE